MYKTFKKSLALLLTMLMIFNISAVAATNTDGVSVKLYWTDDFGSNAWNDAENADTNTIFAVDGFEAGSEVVRYLKIQNTGNLAHSYVLDAVYGGDDASLAEVIDVYVKENVSSTVTTADMTKIGTLADVFSDSKLSEGKIGPESEAAAENFYYKEAIVAVALKASDAVDASYMNKVLSGFNITLTANECEFDYAKGEYFVKFPNTDKYLYRVGNMNAVAVGSLFGATNTIGDVKVTINAIDSECTAGGTHTPNSDWTKGTIQFTGTGAVEVTISDSGLYTEPVSVKVEVINAKNTTSATSVIESDVVLLNDANFSTFDVKNGYTLYGNGFKLHQPNDISYYDWAYSFVTLDNGNLDNVRIVCPNFSYQVLYSSNMSESGNTPGTTEDHYMNCRSAVKMSGDSKISNSYIAGGRVAIFARNGYPVIENTTLYGGAAANIQVLASVNNLVLRDSTLIQEPIQANVNDTSKTMMGLSVVAMCDEAGNGAPITLEGNLVQYAWGREDYKGYIPSSGQSLLSKVLDNKDYIHSITYADGVTADSVNLGFLYMPDGLLSGSSINVTDNRPTKNSIPYGTASVSAANIYSYKNSNGTDASFTVKPSYESAVQVNVGASVEYKGAATDGVSVEKFYDSINGWMSKLTADLDTCGEFVLDFDNIVAEKFGRSLAYTVKDSSGNVVDKTVPITISDSAMLSYVFEITDNVFYGADGQLLNKTEVYTYNFDVTATKTSIEPPKFLADGEWEQPLLLVKANNSDWTGAFPASLGAININYYSTAEKKYKDINLGNVITFSAVEKQSSFGSNNYWEYSGDDFKLKITSSAIHEGEGAYGVPVILQYDGKYRLFFTINTTKGYVSTNTAARTNTLTYEFTDNNGQTIKKTHSYNLNRQNLIAGNGYTDKTQYSYSDFIKGTLTDTANSGGGGSGCLTEGTLITLADGSYKKVEDLTFEDELLVWDFFEGRYTSANPTLLLDDGTKEYDVISLGFDDGTEIDIIDIHGFYDYEANEYVYIDPENVASYVGKKFVKPITDENGNTVNTVVTLTDYEVLRKTIGCYTVLTAYHNNCIANGMFTVTPPPIDGWYDYFEIGEGMKYISMNEDIEKYGLYTYDDFKDYISYEEFILFNGAYLKLLVEKGYFTFEEILATIKFFGVGNFDEFDIPADDDVAAGDDYTVGDISYGTSNNYSLALAAIEETSEPVVIISSNNSVATATYGISVLANGTVVENNTYVCDTDECVFAITATGNASSRYATIKIDDATYYTAVMAADGTASFVAKNAKGKTVTFTPVYGTHENEVTTEAEFYSVSISAQNATQTDNAYVCDTDEAVFTFTASGIGGTGYGIVTIEGKTFYTSQIASGESATITVKNANGKSVEVGTATGTHENETTTEINYYSIETAVENMTATENGYVCDTNDATITFTASGIADGYVEITLDDDKYYVSVNAGEAVDVAVKNAKGKEIAFAVFCGTCENETTSLIDLGTVTYSVDGKKVTLSNTTKYDADGYVVYVAQYVGNKLVNVEFEKAEKLGAKTTKTFEPTFEIADSSELKVFVWKYNSLVPYFN